MTHNTTRTPARHRDGSGYEDKPAINRPTGVYGAPGYGEAHLTAWGQAPGIVPTPAQVDTDHDEALRMNDFGGAFDTIMARVRRNLSDDLDFGDVSDIYEN